MAAKKNEGGLWETEIDGLKYEFEKWGAEDATDTILDLATICGKPLGMGVAAFFDKGPDGESGLDKKLDSNVIGTIMEALTERVGANKQTIKSLIKKLASERVFCDGQKIVFNSHYQDRLDHLFRVVQAALEVQYGNFFGALLGASGFSPSQILKKGVTNRA